MGFGHALHCNGLDLAAATQEQLDGMAEKDYQAFNAYRYRKAFGALQPDVEAGGASAPATATTFLKPAPPKPIRTYSRKGTSDDRDGRGEVSGG